MKIQKHVRVFYNKKWMQFFFQNYYIIHDINFNNIFNYLPVKGLKKIQN